MLHPPEQCKRNQTVRNNMGFPILLDTSKILFSMNVETISDSHNAYKLTFPYEVTGAASGNMTMSVLVTNGAYTDAGSSIVYYPI